MYISHISRTLQVDRYKHLRTRLEDVYDSQRKRGVEIKERFLVKDLGDQVLTLDYALSVSRDTLFIRLLGQSSRSYDPIITAFIGKKVICNFYFLTPKKFV